MNQEYEQLLAERSELKSLLRDTLDEELLDRNSLQYRLNKIEERIRYLVRLYCMKYVNTPGYY